MGGWIQSLRRRVQATPPLVVDSLLAATVFVLDAAAIALTSDPVATRERELEIVAFLAAATPPEHLLVAGNAVVDVDDEVARRETLEDVPRHDPAQRCHCGDQGDSSPALRRGQPGKRGGARHVGACVQRPGAARARRERLVVAITVLGSG